MALHGGGHLELKKCTRGIFGASSEFVWGDVQVSFLKKSAFCNFIPGSCVFFNNALALSGVCAKTAGNRGNHIVIQNINVNLLSRYASRCDKTYSKVSRCNIINFGNATLCGLHHAHGHPANTRRTLAYCWPNVVDGGAVVNQRWANVSCLLGLVTIKRLFPIQLYIVLYSTLLLLYLHRISL